MTTKSYEKRAARELQASLVLNHGVEVPYTRCLNMVRADEESHPESVPFTVRVTRLVATFRKISR